MKRIVLLLLSLILVFSFVACGNEKDTSEDTSQNISQEDEKDELKPEAPEVQDEAEKPSDETTSEEETPSNTPSETPKQETSGNQPQVNKPLIDTIASAARNFKPRVIASRCSHNYLSPTCTSLVPCTICGELLQGLYQGQQIPYGHYYTDNKCNICGYERKGGMLELSGSFFAVNQPITIDVELQTTEKEIEIYPCVTLYKNVNGTWKPYSGLTSTGEFFALEASYGEIVSANGVKYGRWDYMTNKNPSGTVEQNFSTYRLIRRYKISIPETGEFKVEITNGPNNSKNVSGKNYSFLTRTY